MKLPLKAVQAVGYKSVTWGIDDADHIEVVQDNQLNKEQALLFAAAPDLLEALQNIIIQLGEVNLVTTNNRNKRIHDAIHNAAMNAINKAEGE